MLSNNFLYDMNSNMENMKTLQEQLDSGKQFRKPSDDPFKVARAMQLHTQLSTNKQYETNITDTLNWLETTDTALAQVGNVLHRTRELLVSAGNAAYGPGERGKIKDEINELMGQVSQILNTNFDGKYVFGGTRGTSKPITTSKDSVGNTVLSYANKDGSEMPLEIKVSDLTKWSGKNITFNLGSTDETVSVPSLTATSTVSDLVTGLNASLNAKPIVPATVPPTTLNDKIEIKDLGNGSITITNKTNPSEIINLKATTVTDELSKLAGKEIPTTQLNLIKESLVTEISQGVTVDYSINANQVLNYNGNDNDDLRSLFQRIVSHLDNKDPNDLTKDDPSGTDKLTGIDLKEIDDVMNNVLKLRSSAGAKQNRMESAKEQNLEMKFNMTEILSKTEDIDITEKSMEYATMQTVYMAALQVSAKILQPSLMDYLR